MSIRVGLAALVTIAVLAAPPLWAASPPAEEPVAPSLPAPTDVQQLVDPAVWLSYKQRFVSPEGRLADDANGDISHSEGQGYAMLLAVFAGDDLAFSRIWGWTARELYRRGDGLASWRWDPAATPHITDANNATDGDLLIAWGLAEAAARWNSRDYRAAAHTIAAAAVRKGAIHTRFGLTLLPASAGFGTKEMPDGPVVNLSYWVFPAFEALKAVAPEIDWASLTASGLALLEASRFPPARLPPDWISLRGEQPSPAVKFKPEFGYNAIRIPLYLIWGNLAKSDALEPFAAAWSAEGATPAVINVQTGQAVAPFSEQGYAAVAALTTCAVSGTPIPISLKTVELEHYFSTTLHLLALVAARQRSLPCD